MVSKSKLLILIAVIALLGACGEEPTSSDQSTKVTIEIQKGESVKSYPLTMDEARRVVASKDTAVLEEILASGDLVAIEKIKKAKHELLTKSWTDKSKTEPIKEFK